MFGKGYVHVYTGNGKGKTTAALGLAMRAVCAGAKVFMGQFVKGMPYVETKLTEMIENFEMEQWGRDCFISKEPEEEDVLLAKKGLAKAKKLVSSEKYDMIILDELCIALYYKLVTMDEVRDMIAAKRDGLEIVITGRYAPQELIDIADLCTQMVEIKHYYHNGVQARKGIER